MNVKVNGECLNCNEGISVEDLLSKLEMIPNAILVERNGIFLKRPEYPTTILEDNDLLELVKFVGGG